MMKNLTESVASKWAERRSSSIQEKKEMKYQYWCKHEQSESGCRHSV